MIAVVTDSTAQLTRSQAAAAGIHIVPLTVTIEDRDHLEGVDLTAADFYERLGPGVRLATSQPPPGRFLEVYQRLAAGGVDEIVSIHLAEAASGTLNSARVAAQMIDIPVHLVDSRMTSYGLGVVALEAARHVHRDGTAEIQRIADELIAAIGMVFTLPDLDYVTRGGRMRRPRLPNGSAAVPVLGGYGGRYEMIGSGRSIGALVDAMVGFLLEGSGPRHIAIAHAASDTLPFTEGLEARMRESDDVVSVHRYRMGPSVAVHTGPGTAGGFRWPA
jgi:DegV family protein with EDD domain